MAQLVSFQCLIKAETQMLVARIRIYITVSWAQHKDDVRMNTLDTHKMYSNNSRQQHTATTMPNKGPWSINAFLTMNMGPLSLPGA